MFTKRYVIRYEPARGRSLPDLVAFCVFGLADFVELHRIHDACLNRTVCHDQLWRLRTACEEDHGDVLTWTRAGGSDLEGGRVMWTKPIAITAPA